jgi:hypothetical protein
MSDEIRNPELMAEFGHLDNRAMILALWAELQKARREADVLRNQNAFLRAETRVANENVRAMIQHAAIKAHTSLAGDQGGGE